MAFEVGIARFYDHTFLALAKQPAAVFLSVTFALIVVTSLIAGFLLARFCPEAAGSGIPQLKLAFWKDFGLRARAGGVGKIRRGHPDGRRRREPRTRGTHRATGRRRFLATRRCARRRQEWPPSSRRRRGRRRVGRGVQRAAGGDHVRTGRDRRGPQQPPAGQHPLRGGARRDDRQPAGEQPAGVRPAGDSPADVARLPAHSAGGGLGGVGGRRVPEGRAGFAGIVPASTHDGKQSPGGCVRPSAGSSRGPSAWRSSCPRATWASSASATRTSTTASTTNSPGGWPRCCWRANLSPRSRATARAGAAASSRRTYFWARCAGSALSGLGARRACT